MTLYVAKTKAEILRHAIQKIENKTSLTSVGPGSILRSIIESITTEIGDMFNILDFNIAQSTVSTAQGRALDVIGNLYSVERRTLSIASQTESTTGSFLFYLDDPVPTDVVIPKGTKVYTTNDSYIGQQFTYETTSSASIMAGQTYSYAGIKPVFNDSLYTAGANTLVSHSFVSPQGYVVRCNNPKPIAPSAGYESDEEYRTRIIKSIRVTASGTADAIRFKALSYEGVREVRITNNIYGMGTFKVLIIPEMALNSGPILRKLGPILSKVAPVGSTMVLEAPSTLPFTVSINLTMNSSIDVLTAESVRARVKTIVERYINNLLPGSTVVYNRMISLIYGASSFISDVQITSFSANGTEVSRNNYTPKENEQLIPSAITVTSSK